MIISHKHKYIFLHSRKTGGSSVTVLLNRFLGPDDIQIGAWPDVIEAGGHLNRKARGILVGSPFEITYRSLRDSIRSRKVALAPQAVNDLIKGHARDVVGITGGAHPSAKEVRDKFPQDWTRYFKFSFVRNPWTHAVSDYEWRMRVRNCSTVSFKEFLLRLQDSCRADPERVRPPVVTNWPLYTIGEDIVVDHVARYEDIENEIRSIGRRIGLPLDISTVPRAKRASGRRKRVTDYYDAECVELVRDVYHHEIKAFGYAPDSILE